MESNKLNTEHEINSNNISLESINKEGDKEIIQQLDKISEVNVEQFDEIIYSELINSPAKIDVGMQWETEFKKRIKEQSKSKKVKYTIDDALFNTTFHTVRDQCFILVNMYLKENSPERNDFIKYLNVYNESGEKLKDKYFKYDLGLLNNYYVKADEKKIIGRCYHPFNIKAYRNYVFYMVLKLHGEYLDSDDELFNVTYKDDREYNPATKIPSILRGFLPIAVKEYDIKRAFPTFIDMELGTDYRHNIYDILDKKAFAKFLNANSPKRNDNYYYKCIEQLEPVYGNRSYEVLTNERFLEKGRAFRDFTKYEKKFVEKFVKENDQINSVRLHDGIIVSQSQTIFQTKFGLVEFGEKKITEPEKNPEALNTFYYMDDDGKYKITPVRVRDCLIQEGIKRISTPDDQILLIKDNNNVIDPFNHKTDLLILLKNEINEIKSEVTKVENVIAYEYKNSITRALPLITPHELIFYRDSQYTFGLPFNNGFFIMKKNGDIQKQKYNPKNGFFRKHVIQTRDFTYTDEVGDFEKFIINVAGDNKSAFMSMIGYAVHSYKDPVRSPCILLTDEGADDINRDGGRGKSVIIVAFSQVLSQLKKGGFEFDPNYTHVFADLEKGTGLYVIDDVPANFKYEALYTNILGDINCQRKGTKAETIEFSETPKFIISSNWVIPYSSESTSTNRRFAEYKLKKHYSREHTPIDEFGKRFFVDWDINEFNRFYSYIFRCVSLFFSDGLIVPAYDKEFDTFLIKFRNDAFSTEFERILKPLLATKKIFTVTDFYREYNHFENPFKNEKWFHQNNIRNLIDVWLKHYYDTLNYKYWNYSKSHKAWVYNTGSKSVSSIIDSEKKMDDMIVKFIYGN